MVGGGTNIAVIARLMILRHIGCISFGTDDWVE
jgi:hypothetical protein